MFDAIDPPVIERLTDGWLDRKRACDRGLTAPLRELDPKDTPTPRNPPARK